MSDLKKYEGVIPAFYACYDEQGEVSPERTRALVQYFIDKGVQGLYVNGSSGECIYQSVEDRKLILEEVMAVAKGKLTIIAHVACNNTKDSMELARHGESEWNKANLFTGWADVDLSEKGTQQAIDAGKLIKEAGIEFDQAYTSVLKRAIKTTNLALEASDQLWVPVEKSWRLNERHYGGLTGKNKAEAAEQFGDEQVHIWRRSYDVLPPNMDRDDEHSAHTDRRYASLDDSVIPDAENLKVTLERALPFWEDKIAPALKDGKNVFVGAHGNSIRALVKHIKQLSDDEIMDVEIPNFPPLVFEFDEKLNVVSEYYLGK